MWTLSKELEKRLDGTYTSEITCSCTGSESLLEEPSNKDRKPWIRKEQDSQATASVPKTR